MSTLDRLAAGALLALPGALTVWFSFHGGGFFAGTTGAAAVLMALILVVRVTTAPDPAAGFNLPVMVVIGGLALYAVWTLVSAAWSDAAARALLEFDRALLYLLTFVLFASFARSSRRIGGLIRGLALGIAVVCIVALTTRLAPDLWPIATNIESDRLSYPLTYWNALGMLAAVGIVLSLHLAASARERPWVRVAGAAVLPLLAATLLLTLSRGAIAVLAVAVVAYLVLGRPRGVVGALLATVPPTAFAVVRVYQAELLTSEDATAPPAVAQGHDLALVVIACAGIAALARLLLFPLDRRVDALRVAISARRLGLAAAVAMPLVLAAGALVALDAPSYVGRQYDRFLEGSSIRSEGNARGRLTDVGNNGRIDHWEVALDAYRSAPMRGTGAGTYPLEWAHRRDTGFTVVDAHSLPIEVLGELGVVGLTLLAVAVLTILFVLAARCRGPDRSRQAAVFAVALAWVLHSGIDWDWEMPAVSLWFFALAGAGLAARRPRSGQRERERAPRQLTRILVGLALLIVAITPARAALSQHHLDRAVAALKRGDCATAIDAALSSSAALSVRPEPWEVIGYCDVGLDRPRLGVLALRKAIARDPRNWELHYGLALVRGAARLDPRPAARRARRLNPLNALTRSAATRFDTSAPARWEREAKASRLPIR